MSVEHTVRKYEGHTHKVEQYELWPKKRSDRKDWLRIGFMLVMAALLAILAGTAFARPALITSAWVCDSIEDLAASVEDVKPNEQAFNDIESCGTFAVPIPYPADVTVLAQYETKYAVFTFARLDFDGWVQYGYIAVEVKPASAAL